MPELSIVDFSEEDLNRAAIILGYFSHAYYFEQTKHFKNEQVKLPKNMLSAWESVSKKINRPGPALTIYDAVLNNWKFKEEKTVSYEEKLKFPEKIVISDLEPLVTAFDSNAEKVFHLTIVLMEIKALILIRNIIEIDNLLATNNPVDIEKCLIKIIDCIQSVKAAFQSINLNSYSSTYVDPILWCNSIAIFTQGVLPNEPGMSGSSSPLFHILDTLICRESYDSKYGKMTLGYRKWFTPSHQQFIEHVASISKKLFDLRDHNINSLLKNIQSSYTGENGLLEAHKLKIFGYINLMKFTPRKATNTMTVVSTTHEQTNLDIELKNSINERIVNVHEQKSVQLAEVFISKQTKSNNKPTISEINILLPDFNPYIIAGSTIKIFPENNNELIKEVIKSFGANGDEKIVSSQEVNKNLHKNDILTKDSDVPLREVLRNVDLQNYKSLEFKNNGAQYSLTGAKLLNPRYYTIVSHQKLVNNGQKPQSSVTILVRSVTDGVTTNYLANCNGKKSLVEIVNFDRFKIPYAKEIPLVFFAGGTGIASFCMHFDKINSADTKLFFCTRDSDELQIYQPYINRLSAEAEIHILLTRDKKILIKPHGESKYQSQKFDERISDYLLSKDIMGSLLERIKHKKDNGKQANLYICGGAGFSSAVLGTLENIIKKELQYDQNLFENYYFNMISEGRISVSVGEESIKTTAAFNVSELVKHNNKKSGYWCSINNSIYNISKFINQHPGGDKILIELAGSDMTEDYRRIHPNNSEIDGRLSGFYIGDLIKEDSLVNEKIKKILFDLARMENRINITSNYNSDELYIIAIKDIYEKMLNVLTIPFAIENAKFAAIN